MPSANRRHAACINRMPIVLIAGGHPCCREKADDDGDVELSALALTSYVFEHAHCWPDQPAVIDGMTGVVISARELVGEVPFAALLNEAPPAPPTEIGALLTHPAVADAVVIASPDERSGEVPKAFVVLSSSASAEELLNFVADRVPIQEDQDCGVH